uniref:BAG family molecular chaperone regulator 2 n=1 Tax=Panagrolaimus sp. JU765 TaxID=591449 RepID=A0AC34R934_9BILA
MREAACQLEQEKDTLLELISSVKVNAELMRLGTNDREDIDATSERILTRCKAVNVSVFTPRNESQTKALDEVNKLIENVTSKMKDDLNQTRDTITRFLNACCPDDEPGPIDQRFQSRVIECTADDQKKIRRKLKQIIEQIDRANLVYNQNNFYESNA